MAYRSRLRSNTGCSKCRTRRKKCDEQKPICGACQRHLLRCSWTPVKQGDDQATSTRSINPDYEIVAKYFQQRQTVPRGIDLSAYQSQICAAQTLDLCFQGANTSLDPVDTGRNGDTIQSTFSFAPADESLAWDCFVSLGLLVVGHQTRNHALTRAGTSHHLDAMNKVRSSIYDENKRYNLDTLAAISQLAIISTMMPWFTAGNFRDSSQGIFHGAGLLIIFEKMQPQWFQTTHALAFFEYVRSGLLLLALTTQRETNIVSDAWKSIPWARAKHAKSDWHRLLDLFCNLIVLESESRLGSLEKNVECDTAASSVQEKANALLLKLSEWRQFIEPGLRSRLSIQDQAAKLDHCSRSGLSSWQSQRAADLNNLATFNLMVIYLCGSRGAGGSIPLSHTVDSPTCARPQELPGRDKSVLQLTTLALPLSDPFQRAKTAARECFNIWDCAAKDGLYSVRVLHLIGPLLVAEHFLNRTGETTAIGSSEFLRQLAVPGKGRA